MVSRRELFRAAALVGLVAAAPDLLAGCSGDEGGSQGSDRTIRFVGSKVPRERADPAAADAGTRAVLTLAAGLYGRLAGTPGNLALSPFSAAVALGMTVNGAVGRTRDEMLQVLGAEDTASLDDGLTAVTAYVESLAGRVPDSQDEIVLASANQLFGQAGTGWQTVFLDALARSFGAGMREVDFAGHTEAVRKAVNTWTADRTHDRIPEIVPEGSVDALTRLVLVNALYFKAPWLQPFDHDSTRDAPFHLGSGAAVSVPMMHGSSGSGAGDGWRAGHLYYSGSTLAMTVVLPDEGRERDLDALVAQGGLATLLDQTGGEVELSLPRWTFLARAPLEDSLKSLGMPTAFSDDADLSGMTADEKLSVSDVLQQVFIAVDENGTEAAAATAVVVGATSAQPAAAPLVVDRPFLFVIHDVEHGVPLFLGKVVDPR